MRSLIERLAQDARVAIRGLCRTAGFSLTVIVTLAVGIGLATAVFTLSDTLLLRPLPVRDQGQLVVLWGATSDGRFDNFPLLLPDAREFARRTRFLERTEFFSYGGAQPVAVQDGGSVFQLKRALVSGGYLELLGAQPVLGRALRPDDDVIGAAPVIVLSHSAWQRYFGGDRRVLGRRVVLHGTGAEQTIVGVMPRGLDYPAGVDMWAPVIPNSKPLGKNPVYAELNVLGRLRPGASASAAGAELTAYFQRPDAPAWLHDVHGVAHPLTEAVLGDVRPAVLAFVAAAALLLVIACINVANLLLVRGLARTREIAIRSALGAGRMRIVSQLVTESALLALIGGAFGTLLAAAAVDAFVALAPAGTPRLDEIHMNGTAVGGAIAITTVVTLLFAIVPALLTSRVELQDTLRAGTRQTGAGRRFRLGTEALVVGQVAIALLVLSAAGLIARSLLSLERVDLAFNPSHLLVAELSIPAAGFGDTRRQVLLIDRLVPRLEAIPGIRAVSPVLTAPFAVGGIFGKLAAEGQTVREVARNPALIMDVVTPNYFANLGIPVLRGRGFSDEDHRGSTPVAVISESAARHYWPGADPIGKRLTTGTAGSEITIVGVVSETRYRDLRIARPTIYYPLQQSSFPVAPTTLAIRISGPSTDVLPAIRRTISDVDPGVALASASTFESLLRVPLSQPRLNAMLLAVFACAALVLAAVGLFGVMATMVRQRTRELGIRMALGASAANIGRSVLKRGLALGACGAALGLAGALVVNRLLSAMLFGVTSTDAATLAGVTLVLLAVAALASLLPARSSTLIDPIVALRSE